MALVTLVGSTVLFPLIFRASTWACLFCFTTHEERLHVCQMFVGTEGSKLGQCKDALTAAFEGLSDMEINYDERSHLHDAFTQMTLSLQEVAAARGSFKAAFPSAAAKMKRTIHHLKKVQDCILPCVQDVTVKRGDQALFSCIVGFQLPESELTYSWKFAAGGLRTQDVSYFRDVPGAHGYLARIRPVQPTHRGTFSCVILHDQRPLARLYFYLNVTGPPPPGETELQVTFREVMNWTPREAETIEPWRPSLGELLARPSALTLDNLFLIAATAAFVSAGVTMLVWVFFRWYLSGD
ncbi:sperm acrosome membrane-associated protein 6 isoform X5 [Peromyscus eremicus]|uniref:sperm acrosome membrane-associated protein 6 isoform X5 n=1 Tax=Peromyscus eremicus TaxID=42410 RepID=UPI0027DCADC3|nr:sperm acrosome membrane-associated protein 6 isoform X5 [Peromyscus eremicus]